MKNALIAVLGGVAVFASLGWTTKAHGGWEYAVPAPIVNIGGLDDELDKLGAEGWELVGPPTSVVDPASGKTHLIVVLKRPKQ